MRCSSCNNVVPEKAAFCPTCGHPVRSATGNGASVAKFELMPADMFKRVKDVIFWICCISALQILVEMFAPSQYYALGRIGTFIVSAAVLIWEIWLLVAFQRCKSWARKSFMAIAIVFIVWSAVDYWCFGVENFLVALLDFAQVVLFVYGAILCFSNDVREKFLPDCRQEGEVQQENRKNCLRFWIYFLCVLIFTIIYGGWHQGAATWRDDCKQAIENGSESAKEDWQEYLYARSSRSGSSESSGINWKRVLRPSTFKLAGFTIKGVAKVLAMIGALLGGLFATLGEKIKSALGIDVSKTE